MFYKGRSQISHTRSMFYVGRYQKFREIYRTVDINFQKYMGQWQSYPCKARLVAYQIVDV